MSAALYGNAIVNTDYDHIGNSTSKTSARFVGCFVTRGFLTPACATQFRGRAAGLDSPNINNDRCTSETESPDKVGLLADKPSRYRNLF